MSQVSQLATSSLFLVFFLAPCAREASAFSPIQCTQCGTGWDEVAFTWVTDPTDDPLFNASSSFASADGLDGTCCGSPGGLDQNYKNYIDTKRLFVTNRWVRGLELKHKEFMLEEYNYDFLSLFHPDGSTTAIFSGQLDEEGTSSTDAWIAFLNNGSLRFSWVPGTMRFKTDYSVHYDGFQFNRARVCCGSTQAPLPLAQVTWGQRYTGVLLGSGDVVYFKVGRGYTSGEAIHITSWSGHTFPAFRVKARCGALPSETTYDWSTSSVSRWAYLRIPNPTSCASFWYVAVHSVDSSPGQFNLVASLASTSMEKSYRVGIENTASGAELDEVGYTLLEALLDPVPSNYLE